jgi:protein-S-isoprenylcysteine O-methyltransferase Ste14
VNPSNHPSRKRSLWQLIFAVVYLLIFPLGLFWLADDWYWTEGWIFSAIFCLSSYGTLIYLYVKDPALLNERFGSPFQKSQMAWDKVWLPFFFLGFVASFIIIPLDARRFRWSPEFPLSIEIVGAFVTVFAFAIIFVALKENTFAAPVVKMQKERGQRVISSGLYGIVRHPMYSGAVLLFIGTPLLLGSIYGLAIGVLLIILVAVRSIGEEKMLRQELAGYDEYRKRVKWRLIPFVF